ncbi:RCC1 domain-containing protein [Cohnella abietis]|uniref:Uncharacterized protein n=1 Tax=Cohnella abietis TaxID=2507935 RepID=A0A3T1CYJ1_9BACL|nr:hypothetical protein [Cohnella abietis]BBI30910.1 hypothetical protein KCTCHS21_03090 [Cohnella abietis]
MRKGWLSIILAVVLLLVPIGQASVNGQQWRFMEFRAIQHDDNSLTIDGLLEKATEGEEVKVVLSTGDFETVNGRKEFVEIVFSETKGTANSKGYFRLQTPPINPELLKNNELKIILIDQSGQKTGYTDKFPLKLKANDPDLFSRNNKYAKYMDSSQLAITPEDSRKLGEAAVKLSQRVVTGDSVSYFLDDQGKLWGWGRIPGVFDKSTTEGSQAVWRQPKIISAVSDIAQVSTGGRTGALLTKQGEIWQWDHRSENRALVRIGKISGVREIVVDDTGDGLILKKDGTVHSWTLTYGESNSNGIYPAPKIAISKLSALSGITSIMTASQSFYGQTYFALQSNGNVWAWGNMSVISSSSQAGNTNKNKERQIGLGKYMFEIVETKKPQQLKGFPAIRQISLLGGYPLMISEQAELWSYVSTEDTFIKKPGKVSQGAAAVFRNSPYVLMNDGQYYKWDTGSEALSYKPDLMLNGMQTIAAGSSMTSGADHMLAVNAEGLIVGWGGNAFGQLGVSAAAPLPSSPSVITKVANAVAVSTSSDHVLSLSSDGSIYGWGKNESKQINGSNHTEILSPILISKTQDVKKLAAGQGFSLYLNKKGELYGWGNLSRLGMEPSTKPERITLIPEAIKDIDVQRYSVAVLGASGTVYQLGGTVYIGSAAAENKDNFVRTIAQIPDASSISMGSLRGYAVRKDGSVWYWSNVVTEGITAAKQLGGFKNITKLAAATANDEYLLALDKNGDVWGWGDNSANQISHRMKQKLTSPVKVTNEPFRISGYTLTYVGKKLNYRSISASRNGALFLTNDNEMLFMGYPAYPLQAKKLYQNVTFAEAQDSNMYWIIGGKLYVYGRNNTSGQLGNGTKSYYDQPQAVKTAQGATLKVK